MTERERFKEWVNNLGGDSISGSEQAIAWAAWQASREWIPVEERLPKKGYWYLCFYKNPLSFVAFYSNGQFYTLDFDGDDWIYNRCSATHWQPLPEPPEVEE